MADVNKIIIVIDNYIRKSGKGYISAIEANRVLAEKGLLRDSSSRPGKPFRDFLRSGLIPYAYQTGGKGSEWVIPLSDPEIKNKVSKKIPEKKFESEIQSGAEKVNLDEVVKMIEEARLKFKPGIVKYLLIAEAPPENVKRFFYYSDVKKHDWLFLGVMEALFPSEKQAYLNQGRPSWMKEELLNRFKNDGFYLIDLLDYPISQTQLNKNEIFSMAINKIKSITDDDTKILIIKSSIFDLLYPKLLKAEISNVINERITFPASGGQRKFQEEFKIALNKAGYL